MQRNKDWQCLGYYHFYPEKIKGPQTRCVVCGEIIKRKDLELDLFKDE